MSQHEHKFDLPDQKTFGLMHPPLETACRQFVVSGAALVFLFTAYAFPQEPTIRSQTNLVLIPALVKDSQGAIVYGLQANDFIIEDDGVPQSLRLDEAPEGQPISLVVAIQNGRRAYAEFPYRGRMFLRHRQNRSASRSIIARFARS